MYGCGTALVVRYTIRNKMFRAIRYHFNEIRQSILEGNGFV